MRATLFVLLAAACLACMACAQGADSVPSGRLYTWGIEAEHQLGRPNGEAPAAVAGVDSETFLTSCAGADHSVAVNDKGHVYTWGSNDHGQLGRDGSGDEPKLVQTLMAAQVAKVACGPHHTVAVTADGKVFTWGKTSFALGRDHTNAVPTELHLELHAVDAAAGDGFSVLLGRDGRITTFGQMHDNENVFGRHFEVNGEREPRAVAEALAGRKVVQVCAGSRHTVVVTDAQEVFTWGWNKHGQCGRHAEADHANVVDVLELPGRVDAFAGHIVDHIACGYEHTLVVMSSGAVFSFGRNDMGALGRDGDEGTPALVGNLAEEKAHRAFAGFGHSGVVTRSGRVYTWGSHRHRALGWAGFQRTADGAAHELDASATHTAVPGLVESLGHIFVGEVSAGFAHNIARVAFPCTGTCPGHSTCFDGECVCEDTWEGDACDVQACHPSCGEHGTCNAGVCTCDKGFGGDDCSIADTCVPECKNAGICKAGVCECLPGFGGADCSEQVCLNDCSGNGQCYHGGCICNEGFTGKDCATPVLKPSNCPSNCSCHGTCNEATGVCTCDLGYAGAACAARTCAHVANCTAPNGVCQNGTCACHLGWTGADCSVRGCPNKCGGHGSCLDGRCLCEKGFAGVDCTQRVCPFNCNGHGECVNGTCVCTPLFTGADCSLKVCLNGCNGPEHGTCQNGTCVCAAEWTGVDCSTSVEKHGETVMDHAKDILHLNDDGTTGGVPEGDENKTVLKGVSAEGSEQEAGEPSGTEKKPVMLIAVSVGVGVAMVAVVAVLMVRRRRRLRMYGGAVPGAYHADAYTQQPLLHNRYRNTPSRGGPSPAGRGYGAGAHHA